MKRILIGLIVAIVLGASGWFGVDLYVQHRALSEVEAAFEQIRAGGAKASHGKVAFALPSRTLTVEDIAIEPAQNQFGSIKLAKITAVGLRQPDDTRFTADSLDLSGLDIAFTSTDRIKVKANYNVPQISAQGFSGPTRSVAAPPSGGLVDIYRFLLAQYATISARSIAAPSLTVKVEANAGNPCGGEYVYSGLSAQNVGGGKIESVKTDRVAYAIELGQPGKPSKMSGELSGLTISDFDAAPFRAALDEQVAGDDAFHNIYRRISIDTYAATTAPGVRMQVDGFNVSDIAIRPSKFRPAEIIALMPADGALPTPAQSREMMGKMADMLEGFRIGKAEIGKQSVETPQGRGGLRTMMFDAGGIALEGLEMPVPQGQFKMERFALKSFSAANLMRWAASLQPSGQPPSADQMLGLLRVLDGAEIRGVVSPYKNTQQLFSIDTIRLDWGQMVGSIPSRANLVVKMVTPTDPANPALQPLIVAGVDKLAIDLDLGASWTESSGAFALAPATLDLGNLAKLQARLAFANVPRGLFTTDPVQAMGQAAKIEAGTIELSLRDSGAIDLVVAHFARMQNVSRDAARNALVAMIRAQGEKIAASPDARTAVGALAGFVETPGQTLTIRLTPRAKAPLLPLMQLLQTNPDTALAQFRIEASTGL